MYFANVGPKSGPILWRDGHGTIDVLLASGDRSAIGRAEPVGQTEGGIALWVLIVRGEVLPGRWLVLGREFRPLRGGGRAPRRDPHGRGDAE
jgi:hypothetical protein